MPNPKGKKTFKAWLYPETICQIENNYKKAHCRSKSLYIEKAVDFYTGYINADSDSYYVPRAIISNLQAMIDLAVSQVNKMEFRNCVELAMIESILAVTHDKLKYQGHTSMLYDKKNYTMKLFSDDSLSEKQKVSLHGWKKSSKFCLKANYIDFSQSRNIVSANIWSDVVSTRKNLDNHIADLQNYGAIDGYPIMLFVNDEYQGVYTMNIPKDDDTYEIGDDEGEALFVINSPESESAHFRSEMTEEDKKTIFDLEYSFDDDKEWP